MPPQMVSEANKAMYQQVLDQFIPYINEFIDERGGLISLSLLSNDPQVKNFLAQIPPGCDKKITKILEGYSDFFQCLDGGCVATYKGYENGLITEDGKIVKNGAKEKKEGLVTNLTNRDLMMTVSEMMIDDSDMPGQKSINRGREGKGANRNPYGGYGGAINNGSSSMSRNSGFGGAPSGGFGRQNTFGMNNNKGNYNGGKGKNNMGMGMNNTFGNNMGGGPRFPADTLAHVSVMDVVGQEMSLIDALDELQNTAYLDDNEAFVRSLMRVRKVRNKTLDTNDESAFQAIILRDNRANMNYSREKGGCGPSNMTFQARVDKGLIDPVAHNKGKGGKYQKGTNHIRNPEMMGKRDRDDSPVSNALPERLSDAPQKITEKNERYDLVIREMICMLKQSPTLTKTVMELTQSPKVLALKKGVIAKFTTFIQQESVRFRLDRNPEGVTKSEIVTLIWPENECQAFLDQTESLDQMYMDHYPELSAAGPNPPGTAPPKKRAKSGFPSSGRGLNFMMG